MSWSAPRTYTAGEIITASILNSAVRDNLLYLKGVGQVPAIQSGLTIDNSLGSERLLLPLLSTAECSTVLNAEGEVAHDEQTHQTKLYDGTAVRALISEADVDDTPVNGATTVPVSSNWAYDFINTLTTEADIPYATAAGVWARLAKGTAGQFLKMNGGATAPAWGAGSVTSKLLSHTRDMAAANGDVAYTGYGFKPTTLIIVAASDNVGEFSVGFGDVNLAEGCVYNAYVTAGHVNFKASANIIFIQDSSTLNESAVLKTLDVDGFTLTWTKTGTPSYIITFYVLALA